MITTLAVIAQFYQQLQETSVNKIQALRQAQLQLLQDPTYAAYQHPYFCSAILNRLVARVSIDCKTWDSGHLSLFFVE